MLESSVKDVLSIPFTTGGTTYIQQNWLTPKDIGLLNSDWENREAFAGRKYSDYWSYGAHMRPESIFEVGVYEGYSLAAMLEGARSVGHEVSRVFCVDILDYLPKTIQKLRETFPATEFRYANTDSTKDLAVWGAPFDIVHIDGGHDYETARSDIYRFCPLVTDHGLIIVDDVKDPHVMRPAEAYAREKGLRTAFVDNHNGHLLMAR